MRAQRVIADEKVDALIRRIYALQQAGRSVSEPLLDSLHENAALAEYLLSCPKSRTKVRNWSLPIARPWQ